MAQVLAEGGWRAETVRTERVEETLGINEPADPELVAATNP